MLLGAVTCGTRQVSAIKRLAVGGTYGVGVGNALNAGTPIRRHNVRAGQGGLPIWNGDNMEVIMQEFDGVTNWRIEGEVAVLTLEVRIPMARINQCLQGKQLKAEAKITDIAKAYTNACYTSAKSLIKALTGTVRTVQTQTFSAQLQVYANGVPLANGTADTITPAEYAQLIANGGARV